MTRRTPVLILLLIAIAAAGCTAPAVQPQGNSTVHITSVPATILPVSTAPPQTVTITPSPPGGPQIHVDGYWTYPQGRFTSTNPVPLLVHTEAFNTGPSAAREVTASADFWYQGRMVCWDTVYLGTLAAGGHVSTDTLVSCTLPSSFTDPDLEVRFENVAVTQ
jgi:hypothetical protein